MLGIYTRLSREDEESNSIANQQREGKEIAKLKCFAKYELYDEGMGVSGTLDIDQRPVLSKLLNDIKKGKIKAVWMRDQNRLDRNSLTFFIFVDAVQKANIDVYFGSNDKLDFNDPDTLFQSSLFSSFNSYLARKQSKATKRSIRDNFKEGKIHGRIFGYKKASEKDLTMVIHPDEAKIVKYIYDLSLSGLGTKRIAEKLNEEKISTKYKKMEGTYKVKNKYTKKIQTKDKSKTVWRDGTVYGILTNTTYMGDRKLKNETFKSPVIIKPHIWQKVNDNLKSNKSYGGFRQKYDYLLKGLIRCNKCGKNFYGRTRKDKSDNFYMCSSKRHPESNCGCRSINIDFLDNLVWNRLIADDGVKYYVMNYFNNGESLKKLKVIKDEIKSLQNKLESLKRQKSNTIRFSDEISDAEIRNILKDINNESNLTLNKIEELKNEALKLNNVINDQQSFINDFELMKPKLPIKTKIELVNKYIGEISVDSLFDRNAYLVIIKLKLDAELNEMFIIDFYYKYYINASNKRVTLLSKKYLKFDDEQIKTEKRKIYDKFLVDVDIKGDTLDDIEDLILNQVEELEYQSKKS